MANPRRTALVRRRDLEALRERGLADVQALEPGIDLVGGRFCPATLRRSSVPARPCEAASSRKRRSSSAANCSDAGGLGSFQPVRRVYGGGSGLADVDRAKLLMGSGVPGGVRRDGRPERQRGGAGGGYEGATNHGQDAIDPPLRKLSAVATLRARAEHVNTRHASCCVLRRHRLFAP